MVFYVKFWELQQPDEALDEYQAESANAVWDQDNNPVFKLLISAAAAVIRPQF